MYLITVLLVEIMNDYKFKPEPQDKVLTYKEYIAKNQKQLKKDGFKVEKGVIRRSIYNHG